ncbi:queuosine precursor transporter [Rothia nasimurium]|uniref:queuosine precursor transporter n=1 Tax=Rothia nasimurium TaxID=85336 RepID=UPI001F02887B|nr:queuosine precursor transporter [Rothia nasimurium]
MSSTISPENRATVSESAYARPTRTYYDLLLAATCVVFILSNIGATKGVTFGPIITDGGFFLFPLAYVLGDVISEIYGFKLARRAILTSFVAAAAAAASFWILIALPAADFYEGQTALETVLGPVPLILIGSLLGFLTGQLLNSWVLVKLKEKTGGRHLWGRLIGSTLVGELADTLIFCAIAAPIIGITNFSDFLNYAIVGYLYKCAVELILLPITYPVIGWFKRKEPTYSPASEG